MALHVSIYYRKLYVEEYLRRTTRLDSGRWLQNYVPTNYVLCSFLFSTFVYLHFPCSYECLCNFVNVVDHYLFFGSVVGSMNIVVKFTIGMNIPRDDEDMSPAILLLG